MVLARATRLIYKYFEPTRGDMDAETAREIDAAIAAQLAAGDLTHAAELALHSYGAAIQGFIGLRLRNPGDTEEAFGLFVEDLWKGLPTFRGDASFRTWAYQLALNATRRWLKDPYRRRRERLNTHAANALVAEAARHATTLWRQTQAKEALTRIREQLAPEEQELLALRLEQKMDWRDIERVFSTPEAPVSAATLRKRYERLKARLRDLARQAGLLPNPDEEQP